MTTRFNLIPTLITDLTVLQRKPLCDARGCFERMFCNNDLDEILAGRCIAQINHTLTTKLGTVRGMHFQHPPYAEVKFVSCLRGRIFDVAVDLRCGSSTFLHWYAELLSADNHKTLVIPEGFAHGFQALTDDCELLYLHTAAYHDKAEDGLNVHDPRLAIHWPLPVVGLSIRDAGYPLLSDDYAGVVS